MLGTTHSIARLMAGQSFILAAGSIAWPAEYQQADEHTLARLGVSKVMTLTCTYDHRVIQGADSAAFLRDLTGLLAGEGGFYEEVFASLEAPHEPLRMARDRNPYLGESGIDALIDKQASVLQLVNMFRVRGHLLAHTNPLDTSVPTHPELETSRYGLTLWDLDREFATGGIAGERRMTLREIVAVLQKAYCGTIAVEYMHIQEPDQKAWIQQRVEGVAWEKLLGRDDKRRILSCLNAAEAFERFLHTKYVGHKRFSLEGGEALIPVLDRLITEAIERGRHRGGDGHVPPGPPQRPGQHPGQALREDLRGVRGQPRPREPRGHRATSSTTWARSAASPPRTAARPASPWPPTRPTSRRSTRSWRAWPGRSRTSSGTARASAPCRSSSTATPPSPARASWPRRST